jgi:putative FmdB family regulatory protein
VPIYEYQCESCGERFEELVGAGSEAVPCAACGSQRTRRLMSGFAPPGRQLRGPRVRADESRRREREAARGERLAAARKKREQG